jgi:hypothetical protein
MNRINIDSVIEAYERTGVRASQELLYDPYSNCACALGVLLYEKYGEKLSELLKEYSEETRAAADLLELDYVYAREFVAGFDEKYMYKTNTDGYSDGLMVWDACIRQVLVV